MAAADTLVPLSLLQVASRMASPFTRWRKYESVRAEAMKAQLERVMAAKDGETGLSPNTYEIISKSLEPTSRR